MTTLDELLDGHCIEYPKGTPTLTRRTADELLPLVPGWELVAYEESASTSGEPDDRTDGLGLQLTKRLPDFVSAVGLVDRIAVLAEEQQHHPDIRIHGYRNLTLDLSTHSIGGLSQNDFIMAAQVNRLLEA